MPSVMGQAMKMATSRQPVGNPYKLKLMPSRDVATDAVAKRGKRRKRILALPGIRKRFLGAHKRVEEAY